MAPEQDWRDLLASRRGDRVVFLTGAGLSAESGIPTFRGPEGYWTVGSTHYHPTEMATWRSFEAMPEEVWRWYCYRLGVCREAPPNVAHHALLKFDGARPEQSFLITQNVDGLHFRAGQSPDRMALVHGNIEQIRCDAHAPAVFWEHPAELRPTREDPFPRGMDYLHCPECGELGRPHVLWFDEYYSEELYRAETAMQQVQRCDVLVVVGTSGNTNLPRQAGALAQAVGATIIDINPQDNPFAELARQSGAAIVGTATEILPELIDLLLAQKS